MNGASLEQWQKYVVFYDWKLVLLNVSLFSCFLIFFLVPRKRTDWLSLGVGKAFLVAFFTEMYGIPFTFYLLSSFYTFETGCSPILEFMGLARVAWIFWVIGLALACTGLTLIFLGWTKIYFKRGGLVRDGIYKYSRHPQYLGIILLSTGFLVCWPTLLALAMWPVLLLAYYKLAKMEEQELVQKFGKRYEDYKRKVPMFL